MQYWMWVAVFLISMAAIVKWAIWSSADVHDLDDWDGDV